MASTSFFQNAFGFAEADYESTRAALLARAVFTDKSVDIPIAAASTSTAPLTVRVAKEHCLLASKGGARAVDAGTFWTPSVAELRAEVAQVLGRAEVQTLLQPYREAAEAAAAKSTAGKSRFVHVSNTIGDSRQLHKKPSFRNAVFQAASQFNYLEFPGPKNLPENGITKYVNDHTQGPACAIACAAGTAYRNYLAAVHPTTFGFYTAPTPEDRGQRRTRQFNGIADVEEAIGGVGKFFSVHNGYVDSSRDALGRLNAKLSEGGAQLREALVDKVRIAIQQDAEVTDVVPKVQAAAAGTDPNAEPSRFLVTQTYNSAFSVSYSSCPAKDWDPIARIILDGTYEATLLMGVLQTVNVLQRQAAASATNAAMEPHALFPALPPVPPVLLTKVGGGVFGNPSLWIRAAMDRSFSKVAALRVPIAVAITHFGHVEESYGVYDGKSF